ncbi:MAG: hypothetical protein NT031_05950 [Planctomycetota bacterium]|nr:hypothetical protein [Planctomycetota bacterium]
MDERTIGSLEDIWPLQAALNKKAGIDTAGLGEALKAAEGEGGQVGRGGR